MPSSVINGVELHFDDTGSGQPLVLVHGSWTDRRSWDLVARSLAERFRVVTYDRRGHSQSERPPGQGSVHQDVADLAALIESLAAAPAHVIGNSFGGSITLRLAAERPDLMSSLSVHEPPLFGLLADDPTFAPVFEATSGAMEGVIALLNSGDMEGGARQFAEMVLGPGVWEGELTPEERETSINNAPTFLDETRDPESLTLDPTQLSSFTRPALLSLGSMSPPFFSPVITRLAETIPSARQHPFEGAGHVPHRTHADLFVEVISSFVQASA
jgi:pimeloyl-ACP methyl ester carboxylesterase